MRNTRLIIHADARFRACYKGVTTDSSLLLAAINNTKAGPTPFSGAANFQEEIRKTTNLLTTAQISLYPIAAEGLTSDVAFQANNREITERRGNLSMQDTLQQSRKAAIDLDASHASMEQLRWAEENGSSFLKATAEAALIADLKHYNLLRPVLLELKKEWPRPA